MEKQCCHRSRWKTGIGPFFGRFLISLIFILAGVGKALDFKGAVDSLASTGIPGASVWIFIALVMELVGGILLLLGWFTPFAVYVLMIFLLPVTFIFHGFWNYPDAERALQLSIFLRNLTIYGGLLLLLSFGPGRWSIDATRCTRPRE